MMFALRPYQRAAVSSGLAYLTDPKLKGRNGLIVAPTGSGKSLLVASLATRLPGPCVVFQPSKEILEQNAAKLAAYGYPASVFSASLGRKEVGQITLATIGSVVRHVDAFKAFPFVLVDECHLVNAKGGMYRDFLQVLDQARVLGLTATPFRLASNSWGSTLRFLTRTRPRIFQDVVHYTQIADLTSQGYLAKVEYRPRTHVQQHRLRMNTTGADYTDESVRRHFAEIDFAGYLQWEVKELLREGRKNILVFTRFVEESHQLARMVPGVAVVTAETPVRERAQILDDFKSGTIPVVSNVGIIALGFDFPELETVVLARPTVSLALYYQQIGRAIRPHPEKKAAVVVDLVGTFDLFGRIENLMIRPGGVRGDSWVMTSGTRQLTNIYFGEQSA